MPNPPLLEGLPEELSIVEAATALNMHHRTIRRAIRSGEIPAHVIGGRDPLRSGRGMGYRIKREDLQRWYFGEGSLS